MRFPLPVHNWLHRDLDSTLYSLPWDAWILEKASIFYEFSLSYGGTGCWCFGVAERWSTAENCNGQKTRPVRIDYENCISSPKLFKQFQCRPYNFLLIFEKKKRKKPKVTFVFLIWFEGNGEILFPIRDLVSTSFFVESIHHLQPSTIKKSLNKYTTLNIYNI